MSDLITLPIPTLEWAAAKVNMSLADVATRISKKEALIHGIVASGEMTLPQAKKFAEITKQPLGFLFLDTPPNLPAIELPDLRTRPNHEPLSDRFFEVYKDIKFKQEWYREYLISSGHTKLEFVGAFSINDDTNHIVENIRHVLNIGRDEYIYAADIDNYHDILTKKAEDAGILVFRNGVVKSNTRMPLSVYDFLGFAITDAYAPAIFINASDKTAAKIFTIAHELAHVWLGEGGVDDMALNASSALEKKCNEIASELLVPKVEFLKEWKSIDGTIDTKLTQLRNKFRVSELVIARLANEFRLLPIESFQEKYQATKAHFESQKSTGGDGRAIAKIRNSRKLSDTVEILLKNGALAFRDAGLLLNKSAMKVGI